MKRFTYIYTWSYLTTITIMLQQSDYGVSEFLRWFWFNRDFRDVSSDYELDKTEKAVLVLKILKLLAISSYAAGLGLAVLAAYTGIVWVFVLGLGLILAQPVLTPHLVFPLLWIGYALIQKPREEKLIKEATKIFKNHKGYVIGVAGSYGKTSMKEILATVIGAGRDIAVSPGNQNTPIGIAHFAKKLTGKEDVVVVEMGEYVPGDITKMCAIAQPDAGIMTGVNQQHMIRMKSIDNIKRTLFELSDYLGIKPFFYNNESEYMDLAKPSQQEYSRRTAGDWYVKNAVSDLSGTSFDLTKGKRKISIKSGLLGKHNIGPLAVAVQIADNLGMTTAQIKKGIADTKPHERRFSASETTDGTTIIDDTYNGNPDGFKVAIEFLNDLDIEGKRIYATPGMIELGASTEQVHKKVGKILGASRIETIVLIRNRATEWLADGIYTEDPDREILWVDDPKDFYENIGAYSAKGDVVFLQNSPRENFHYERNK